MKNLFLSAIITLMAINLGLYAQEKETAQAEQPVQTENVTLELLYKKEFNEIISADGFPPPEIKQILRENDIPQEDKDWLLNSLRIEIAKRKKILYTNDGEVVQLPDDLKSITTSDNLKYMIVYAAHYDYGGMSREDAGIVRRKASEARRKSIEWGMKWEEAGRTEKYMYIDSVYYWIKMRDSLGIIDISIQKNTKHIKTVICLEAETGKILWEKEGWINTFYGKGEDIMFPSYISNDGKVSVSVPGPRFVSSAIFYNEKGEISGQIGGLNSISGYTDLSADGRRFYAAINIRSHQPVVACFDGNGNELWKQRVPGDRSRGASSFVVADNHKYAVISLDIIYGGAATTLIDEDANIIAEYDFGVERSIMLSSDGQYLAIPSDGGILYFIKSSTGEILWQKSMLSRHSVCYIPSDAKFILEKDAEFIRLYNKDGQILLENSLFDLFEVGSSSSIITELSLFPTGNYFLLKSNIGLVLYRIEVSNKG